MVESIRATLPEKVRLQIKYLRERLDRAVRAQNVYGHWGSNAIARTFPTPPAVAEAEKRLERDSLIVSRHQKKRSKFEDRQKQTKLAAVRAIEEQMNFGKPQRALDLLKAFETKIF